MAASAGKQRLLAALPSGPSSLFLTTPAAAISSAPMASTFLTSLSFGALMWHKRSVAAFKRFWAGNLKSVYDTAVSSAFIACEGKSPPGFRLSGELLKSTF